jgi:hypothetical protein
MLGPMAGSVGYEIDGVMRTGLEAISIPRQPNLGGLRESLRREIGLKYNERLLLKTRRPAAQYALLPIEASLAGCLVDAASCSTPIPFRCGRKH